MTEFLQQIEKHRWILPFAVCLSACAVFFYAGFHLWTGEDLHLLKNGLWEPQHLEIAKFSVVAIFFLFAAATLISEDLACISAGILASQGKISLALAISSCAFGIFVGDILLFLAGRFLGRRALKFRVIGFFISENAFQKSSDWLEKQGVKTVLVSRFVFGLRLPLYFAAGVLRTSAWRFALYFSLAVAVWTPLIIGLTYWLGAEAVRNSLIDHDRGLGLILLAVVLFFVFRFLQQMLSFQSRRLFWGRIKRRFFWEFWSIRVFYLPVVVYVAFLALRFRSLTVFTCANPSILAGGFVGESKEEIFEGLKKSIAAAPFLLKHVFIARETSGDEKLKLALRFMNENELSFPVVLKPDVGERGAGVRIVETAEDLAAGLSERKENLILQEFAPGEETSVFYYRYPTAEQGRIFAVTEKRFPQLTGDGITSLGDLILRDKRAVCLAKSYLERNRAKLATVPRKGECVPIIDIGTHSRGAIFLDGGWMKTPQLERAIDEICRGFDGFYFGRFDIRVRSFGDFSQAKNFKIVELNGVTSEATNIYDPKNSLFDAYRILFRQWRIAFEIGAENQKLGARAVSVSDLIKLTLGKQIRNPSLEI